MKKNCEKAKKNDVNRNKNPADLNEKTYLPKFSECDQRDRMIQGRITGSIMINEIMFIDLVIQK